MKNKFFQFLILGIILLLIVKGQNAIIYAKDALELCYHMIIPTLFPFFICSGLLIYSGFCESLSKIFVPVMRPLFNVNENASAAFVLGIISGYPLGAVTVCDLYQGFYISKTEAERMLGFCNNSGPLFILGSVGIGLYSGLRVGVLIYVVHILSAILVGMVLKFYKKDAFTAPNSKITVNEQSGGFGTVLENSVKSILNVCGAVMFFSVVSRLLLDFVSIKETYMAFVYGICEFASGTQRVSALDIDFASKLILSSFIVGFAGLSVHIQVLGVVSKYGLSMKPYIFAKLLQGLFSCVLMYFSLVFTGDISGALNFNLGFGFMFNSMILMASVLIIFAVGVLVNKYVFTD